MIKSLILLLYNSKIVLAAGTIVLAILAYVPVYGWGFAVGFIGLILCHEMGHYVAAKQKGLSVGLPMFIPFVGAWVTLKEQPLNAETEAYIAYAGPLVGSMASFALYFWGRAHVNDMAVAVAQSGFLLNLLNLIPIHPLDGGRITAVLSPRLWLLGAPILTAVWIYYPSPLLIIIAILSLPQLIKAWHPDANTAENQAYYQVPATVKFEYGTLYIGLVVILALILQSLNT